MFASGSRLRTPTLSALLIAAYDLQANGRSFPPKQLHESWMDYLYWDIELEP